MYATTSNPDVFRTRTQPLSSVFLQEFPQSYEPDVDWHMVRDASNRPQEQQPIAIQVLKRFLNIHTIAFGREVYARGPGERSWHKVDSETLDVLNDLASTVPEERTIPTRLHVEQSTNGLLFVTQDPAVRKTGFVVEHHTLSVSVWPTRFRDRAYLHSARVNLPAHGSHVDIPVAPPGIREIYLLTFDSSSSG